MWVGGAVVRKPVDLQHQRADIAAQASDLRISGL